MKITSIELYSNGKNSASFSFRDPAAKNPYIVQGVFGLDADEIVPKFYGFSSDGASKYYDMGLKSREIVIRVALNPNLALRKAYSDLRDDLYRVISASRTGKVELRFNNGTATVASIFGLVTKFEAPHFNQLPEVQLTIYCEDPMFRAIKPVEVSFFSLGTEMNIKDQYSTSPHGFSFDIKFTQDTPSFIMKDQQETWIFTVTPGTIGANTGFKTNDEFYFSSEFNEKKVYIKRATATILLVDKVQLGSTWPMIFPGSNQFEIVTGNFDWNTFTYYPTYWGV
jgi:hypothetical protein